MKLETNALYRAMSRSMIGRYSVYLASLVSMMILARIFSPEYYGTVAAVVVFYLFFQLISEAGLGPAIINLEYLSSVDRNGLFGLTITAGACLSIIFYSLAPLFVVFYDLPRVDEVVPYIAASLLFSAAAIVPNAFLLRDQAFYRFSIAGFAAELVSSISVIGLSFLIDPLHALASKGPISALTMFLFVWYFSTNTTWGRPALGRKFSAILPLLGFSGYQFGFNFINFFSRNLDNILIGRYMGASILGSYDRAYQLMRYPLMLLTSAMTPAIQPVIRKFSGDRIKVEAIHRDFTLKLSIVGALAGLSLFVTSEWIVLIVLGNQWQEVVPLIRILSIAIPVQIVLSTSGSFFQAMNRADVLFLSGFISAIVMVSSILIGIFSRDVILLSWCLVAAFHINFIQAYYLMYKRVFMAPLAPYLLRMIPASCVILGMVAYSTAKTLALF